MIKVYKIIFRMRSPAYLPEPLHLDGLLDAVHPNSHKRRRNINFMSSAKNVEPLSLPIARAEGIYCCTAYQLPEEARLTTEVFTKRKTAGDETMMRRKFVRGSGAFKDSMIKNAVTLTPYVYFYAATDEKYKYALTSAFSDVSGIGSLRKMGFGDVGAVEVWETEKDWRECLVVNKTAMRALPIDVLRTGIYPLTRGTVRAPYWLHSADEPCVNPGMMAELRNDITCAM